MVKIYLIFGIRRSGTHFCCNLVVSNWLKKDTVVPIARNGINVQSVYFRDNQRYPLHNINNFAWSSHPRLNFRPTIF